MENNEQSSHVVVGSPDPTELKCEASSVKARQRKVKEALLSLGMKVTENSAPPVIAVMGSGGGLRAMVGFLGVLTKLSELKLLDVVTYVCGVSGSTWCLSSVCHDKKWSDHSFMEHMENTLSSHLKSSWDWKRGWEKVKETFSEDKFSLTNIWGYLVVNGMIRQINEDKLSSHKDGCESGENPYPIYSAVEKKYMANNDPGAWFEFTPHLSGFPAHGCYVKTELLGSKFKAGKLLETHPESELCFLHGMWGSAFADNEIIRDQIKNFFHFFTSGSGGLASRNVLNLFQNTELDAVCKCIGCTKIQELLVGDSDEVPQEKQEEIWQGFAETLEGAMTTLMGGSDDDCLLQSGVCDGFHVLRHTLGCLIKWEWGTINNFLYKLKSDTPSPIFNKEHISLIDAGLEINVAFPLMLPPHRKVDLILSFDFSEGDPFLTLKQTSEYCKKNGVKFPTININDKDKDIPSKCCYIFDGDDSEAPDVIHIPLFNNQTCKDNVTKMRENYTTAQISYDETQIKDLLEVAHNNVSECADDVQKKIRECAQKCQLKSAA